MAFQSITSGSYTVHPSANDVASTTGDGSYVKETILTDLLDAIASGDWIVQGFGYNTSSGLTATFDGGQAVIGGYLISRSGTFNLTLTDGAGPGLPANNHVYLTFSVDSNDNVDSWGVEVNTTGTAPTGVPGYAKLAIIEVESGAVTDVDESMAPTTHPLDNSAAGDLSLVYAIIF